MKEGEKVCIPVTLQIFFPSNHSFIDSTSSPDGGIWNDLNCVCKDQRQNWRRTKIISAFQIVLTDSPRAGLTVIFLSANGGPHEGDPRNPEIGYGTRPKKTFNEITRRPPKPRNCYFHDLNFRSFHEVTEFSSIY